MNLSAILICAVIFFSNCSSKDRSIAKNEIQLKLIDSVKKSSRLVSLRILDIQNKHFLYAGGENKTLEIYAIDDGGKLNFLNQEQIADKNGGIRGLTQIKTRNEDYLILGNKAANSLDVYKVKGNGSIEKTYAVFDSDSTYIDEVVTIHNVLINNKTFIYAGGLDKGISCFEFTEKEELKHIQSIKDNDSLSLHGIIGMSSLMEEKKRFLVTGAFFDGSISSFQIAEDGCLKKVSTIEDNDSLFLNGAFPVSSIQLGDSNFLLVGHRHNLHYNSEKDKELYHGDGINVFKMDAKGIPHIHSLLEDNEDYFLKGSTRIETIKLNDKKALVFIGTRDDKGIQVCVLGEDGILHPKTKIDLGFSVYNGMTIKRIHNKWYLYIGAYDSNTIQVYSIDFK